MIVLDASAPLAFLQDEPGADDVERALEGDACCGAASWSEVAQKVRSVDGDWELARALLLSYDLDVGDVTRGGRRTHRAGLATRQRTVARRPAVPGPR